MATACDFSLRMLGEPYELPPSRYIFRKATCACLRSEGASGSYFPGHLPCPGGSERGLFESPLCRNLFSRQRKMPVARANTSSQWEYFARLRLRQKSAGKRERELKIRKIQGLYFFLRSNKSAVR